MLSVKKPAILNLRSGSDQWTIEVLIMNNNTAKVTILCSLIIAVIVILGTV